MVLTQAEFQRHCPKGLRTLDELADVKRHILDGDPDGRVEEILEEDEDPKQSFLDFFNDDPQYTVIGGVVYHWDDVDQLVEKWLEKVFKGMVGIDMPEYWGQLQSKMIEAMEDTAEDEISSELLAQSFRRALSQIFEKDVFAW